MALIDLTQRSLTEAIARDGAIAIALDESLTTPLAALPSSVREKILLTAPIGVGAPLEIAHHESVGALILSTAPPTKEELAAGLDRLRGPEAGAVTSRLTPGTPVASMELTESARRGAVLDAIDHFFKPHGFDVRLLNHLLSSADGFLTNALYNAPLDGMGGRIFAHRSKIDPVVMPVDHPIRVSWGFDGRRALVAVRDSFGSFDRQTLLRAIPGWTEVARAPSSRGLGLRSALRSASVLAFHVRPGSYTEAVAVVDVQDGYRQFVQRGKVIEIFYVS